MKYFSIWKTVLSVFSDNYKPFYIPLPEISLTKESGFVQNYDFSFFSMFRGLKNKMYSFYRGTDIPILMIFGAKDELFSVESFVKTYNEINNTKKKIINMEEETHTSIIWNAGPNIEVWLKNIFK